MKTTITVNIKNQLNDAHALGFESGYEAGIRLNEKFGLLKHS